MITRADHLRAVAADAAEAKPIKAAAELPGLVLDRKQPLETAVEIKKHVYPHLVHQQDTFFRWIGTHYVDVPMEELRANIYRLTGKARTKDGGEFNPDNRSVSAIVDALRSLVQLPSKDRPPAWINRKFAPEGDPADIVAVRNGLLNLRTRKLHPPTPDFFNTASLPFDYEPNAPAPVEWLRFLATLWPDDQQSIDSLQELFGLLLTPITHFQKMFMMVGPKRSGKGTIAAVLRALLGVDNVAGPTLSSLAQNFGLAPLIGKPLAIITDARLGRSTDPSIIAERLLSVSGEDAITIDRKYTAAWTGRLAVRFLVHSNELPKLSDASGALASRFVIWQMTRSFYGAEDTDLPRRLMLELPSILVWGLAGLDRLRARGHFVQPVTASRAIEMLEDLASPVGAFLKAVCVIGPDQSVDCGVLFERWRSWCRQQNRDAVGTTQSFGRDLSALIPALATRQPRIEGKRLREYIGIGLNRDYQFGVELPTAIEEFGVLA